MYEFGDLTRGLRLLRLDALRTIRRIGDGEENVFTGATSF